MVNALGDGKSNNDFFKLICHRKNEKKNTGTTLRDDLLFRILIRKKKGKRNNIRRVINREK